MHFRSISVPKLWFVIPDHRSSVLRLDGQCDCDCACPDLAGFSGSHFPLETLVQRIKTGRIRSVYLNEDIFLKGIGTHKVALSANGGGVVVLDSKASCLLPSFRTTYSLGALSTRFPEWPYGVFEQIIAVLLALNVVSSPQVKSADLAESESRALVAGIHLTNQCNLSCRYCYVRKDDRYMGASVAQRSVDAVYRSALAHGYSRVKLKYSGGEPTLNFGTLQVAQQRAEVLSAQTGVELESVLLTNGMCITDTQIDTLLAHDISVAASLDGVGRYQDMQRPLAGGSGSSFERVTNTLDRLLARGICPHISVTITKQNLSGLPELVEYLLDRKLRFSFNFYREPNCSGEPNELSFTPERTIEGLQLAFRVIERRLPRYSLLSNLTDRANLQMPHLRTCGVGHNYMLIDCDGNVPKCQMDMEYPITTIDADDPLALVRADTTGIQNLTVDQKECRECIWRYRCTGGCSRLTFQRTGRYDARSPLCEVYQAILPEVVRLEALRLVKHEEPWDFSIH